MCSPFSVYIQYIINSSGLPPLWAHLRTWACLLQTVFICLFPWWPAKLEKVMPMSFNIFSFYFIFSLGVKIYKLSRVRPVLYCRRSLNVTQWFSTFTTQHESPGSFKRHQDMGLTLRNSNVIGLGKALFFFFF